MKYRLYQKTYIDRQTQTQRTIEIQIDTNIHKAIHTHTRTHINKYI